MKTIFLIFTALMLLACLKASAQVIVTGTPVTCTTSCTNGPAGQICTTTCK